MSTAELWAWVVAAFVAGWDAGAVVRFIDDYQRLRRINRAEKGRQ